MEQDALAAGKPSPLVFESAVSRWQAVDTLKKLIRTAEIKFKAAETLQSALAVERIAQQHGGFVLENNYTESEQQRTVRRISEDSSEITTVVQPQSHLIIRVPWQQLDTTLRSIGRLAQVINFRNLHAKDVSLDILEQQLAALRNQSYGNAVSNDITEKGKQLQDITAAREREFNAKQGKDIADIERMRIEDQVRFSTVTVDIYQENVRRFEKTAFIHPAPPAWSPRSYVQAGAALAQGWKLIIDLLILLLRIWPLWIVVIAGWWWKKSKS